jgi:drug/metabolite transporter (DMT)-like permease
LATAFFYAGYLLSLKLLRHSFSTSTIMAWTGLTTCPLLLAVALASGEGLRAATSGGWCVLVALALSSHVGGQGLIAYAAAHMPASFLSVALLFQPVVAAILAWLLLREPMKPLQIVGGLTVLAGIGLAKWGTDAAPPRAQDLEREPRS